MTQFWEIMNRAINTGRLMRSNAFQKGIFEKASAGVKKYDITFDPQNPVTCDDDMIDRLFQAGIELYEAVGTYCINTSRVVRFDRAEIDAELRQLAATPAEIVVGAGAERRVLRQRRVGENIPPLVIAGFIEDSPREGRDFVQMYKSVAQEGIIDGFYFGPAPRSIEGVPFVLNSPLDIHAVKSSVWWVREALRASGRPGMHLLDGGCSAIASIATTADENGLRKTDAFVIPTISELSVDYDILNKVAHSMAHGILRNSYWTVIVGGYAGGPEGAAIVGIASALNAIMVYKSRYAYVSTLMVNPPVNSARATLWVRNICIQCLNRHTAMICGGGGATAAGPGTEQQLLEIAALAIVSAAAGGHIFHGFRKSKLVKANQGTGMEPRWGGETAKAAAEMTRGQANELVLYLLSRYEKSLHPEAAPEGFAFEELYDPQRVQVGKTYFGLYEKVKADLTRRGLNYP